MDFESFMIKFKPILAYQVKKSNIRFIHKSELYYDLYSTCWLGFRNGLKRNIKNIQQLKNYVTRAIKNRICDIYYERRDINIEARFNERDSNMEYFKGKKPAVVHKTPQLKYVCPKLLDNFSITWYNDFDDIEFIKASLTKKEIELILSKPKSKIRQRKKLKVINKVKEQYRRG